MKEVSLISFIGEAALGTIAFKFPMLTCMHWIASKTAVSLFNLLILEELESKLKSQRASRRLFSPAKQKGGIEGIAFLILMVALLFVPLMIMSSRERSGEFNPMNMSDGSFGVSSLPPLYEYERGGLDKNHQLDTSQGDQIRRLNDSSLNQPLITGEWGEILW